MVDQCIHQLPLHSWMVCRPMSHHSALVNLCLFRFFFATLLSVYNKWMFSPDRYGFPSPFFVTTAHMWVQFALASLLRYTLPRHFRPEQIPTREDYM